MEALAERRIGCVTVLFGARGGKYPQGNTLLVGGRDERVAIDPSLGLLPRRDALPPVDRVLNSHCHEDHIAGNHLFPRAPWHLHEADLPGIRSLDGLMAIYGYAGPIGAAFRRVVVDEFHFEPRLDAVPFRDGDVFELGGARIRVIHAPGHTRGHSFFWIEPEGVLYLGDVDLSSFGPYYGDAWSDLEDFERTLARLRPLAPRHWATFHHVGVIDSREVFLERLDRFEAVIADRERRLLDYLGDTPHSLAEIARHRFVYRPQDEVPFAEAVEARSMAQHLVRLGREGRVQEVEPGRFLAAHKARAGRR